MDYEKAYKNALKRAEKLYEQGTITESLSYVFPELQESEDERNRKGIIKFLTDVNNGAYTKSELEIASWITWLEKQGRQKQETNYPKFDFDDILALQCCMETVKKVQEDKELYERLQRLHNRLYDAYLLEKQGEQKTFDYENATIQQKDFAPKPESKFKVGDWFVKENIVYHIDKISGVYLTLSTLDGTELVYHKSVLENDKIHLWTIADARDGDVLAFKDDSYILLVKEVHNTIYGMRVSCYCHVLIGKFETAEYQIRVDGLYPATKEQRDLLFAKMHEEGYEWDAEKKEVKKLENQGEKPNLRERYENIAKSDWFKKTHEGMSVSNDEEPKWTGEDERIRKKILSGMKFLKIQGRETFADIPIDDCIAWLEKQAPVKFNDEKDERIRKEIRIILLNTDFSQFALDYTFADMLSWLEKQGN